MHITEILFWMLTALALFSALMVVSSDNPVHSVLWLILVFIAITGHYILMNAQFLAIVNMIVYAGAIMVLFLFVLMLLNLSKENEPKSALFVKVAAVIAGGVLFTVIIAALREGVVMAQPGIVDANDQGLVQNLGQLLFTKYVLPFEISSVLFIASMVGAILLAKREKQIVD
jgi:NADH-quinone oxidoreductase subunit J